MPHRTANWLKAVAIVLSSAGIGSASALIMVGRYQERIDRLERQVQAQERDHDLLTEVAADVRWIKRTLDQRAARGP